MKKDNYIYDNEVWKYRITLNDDSIYRTIYTKPLPNGLNKEQLVQDKYFTKECIEELKQLFIKKIQETENPFNIYCCDIDGGYKITKEQLFDIDYESI